MSVDQLPTGKTRPAPRDVKLVRYDEYVDKQIQSTRRTVKLVDVTTALLVIVTSVIGFLLAAAVVEHWLVPGGFSVPVRAVLFAVLVGGCGYFAVRRLGPLLVRSINPAYAAQAIEQDNPSLKNSLLNLVLFRQHRHEITDAVYETLEEQAAQRLVRVPVESAVDRTQLLRLGYVLLVVVLAAAAYKIFSPKDPLVTARRVLIPWADVVPASRVSITNVEPGATTLARGDVLAVSADVLGIGDDDLVVVRYTTADGQAVDKPVPMKPSAAGLRYTGQIPAAEPGRPTGIAQNLRYRIEAGDARSLDYAVTVVAAPTITVDRIDYDYPDYTGFADHSVDRLGDIRAIEGTCVTIHARANQPIAEAALDFEADGRRDIVLNVDGNQAQTSFVLALRDDRQTPKFTSYALRFAGTDGRPNRDPAIFPIDVLPDYAPEVAILAPTEKVRDVRLDETVLIQFEARDPDFALAEMRIHAEAAGQTLLDEPAMAGEHRGRFGHRLPFTPSEYGLQPGDVVRYWATARDQRPNETTGEAQSLRIVSPDPKQPGQPPPDRLAQREPQPQQPGEQQQQGERQPGESGEAGGESSSSQGSSQQAGEPASAGGEAGTSSTQHSAETSGEQGGQQSGESQSRGEPSGEQGGQFGEQSGGTADAGKPGSKPSGSQDGASASGADRQRGQQRDNPSGEERSNNGQPQPGERGTGEQPKPRDESPVSPEGDNDGEAFDRIREFLKREGQLPERGEQQNQPQGESASADSQQREDGNREAEPGGDPSAEQRGGETPSGKAEQKTNQPADQGEDSRSPDGQETTSQGESGAGDQPEQGRGAPETQPTKPTDKWQQKPSGDEPTESADEEPSSGGRDKHQSDSQGEQGGDRTGGGEEGGGQKSEREGTGSAGQNQSADEGAGESSEQGAGRDSSSAGQDAKSDNRTGQSGSDEKGEGSVSRTGENGKNGGDSKSGEPASAGGQQPQSTPDQSAQPAQQPRDDGTQEPGDRSGSNAAPGAGRTPDGTMSPSKSTGTAPEADAANLDYARRQTDLVLESLEEQLKRKQLDRRLLDELGWSEEDLRRFLERWQQLKAAARDDGPAGDAAQRELDDALRSLGLNRGVLQQRNVSDDELRNLRQGYRGAVPLEYQERLRAYNQGVSRARQDGE